MAIIKVRDENGDVIDIPAFVGPKGDPGADYALTESDKAEIAELAAELVEVPEGGGGDEWITVCDVTLTEEVDCVECTGLSLKKIVIAAKVNGSDTNTQTGNGSIFVNGKLYFYPNYRNQAGVTRWAMSMVEVCGQIKRHTSAVCNNNSYQSTLANIGHFGDGSPIESVKVANLIGLPYKFGIGTEVKIYGVRA